VDIITELLRKGSFNQREKIRLLDLPFDNNLQ
jgi:hypothetical protein